MTGSVTNGRRAWRRVRAAPLDCAFALLLAATIIALVAGDRLLDRSFTIDAATAPSFLINAYGDDGQKGGSTITVDSARPLAWRCELKAGYDYPYCGYEILFGGYGNARGLDLSAMDSISLELSYHGPGETVRLNLKNFDPRYSRADRPDSAKPAKVELFVRSGERRRIEIRPADFSVAEWWLTRFEVPHALSRPQFDNVIGFDIQTGSWAAKGRHDFQLHRITFHRKLIATSDLYSAILAAWMAFAIVFLLGRLAGLRRDLKRRKAAERAALAQARAAERSAITDPLTGIANRRGLVEGHQQLVADAAPASPISLILVDIDHFKRLNDTFGHNAGDEVLTAFAGLLAAQTDALVGRWGGEEFVLVRSGSREDAMAAAERLRQRVAAHDFGACGPITASFGVHSAPAAEADLNALVARADEALYTAKQRGRNRAVFYTGAPQLVA